MNDSAMSHYGSWGAMAVFIGLYALMIVFIPFYQKSQRKPASVYLAFAVAYALEMFGVPLTLYMVSWAFGWTLPEGVLWGHTLFKWIGYWGMYGGVSLMLVGMALVVSGWNVIYRRYWSQDRASAELVTTGIYRYLRHPQYTGFLLITLGMICEWATLPLVVTWPILALMYYRLARKEEAEVEARFGEAYRRYRAQTGMFLPPLSRPQPQPQPVSR